MDILYANVRTKKTTTDNFCYMSFSVKIFYLREV